MSYRYFENKECEFYPCHDVEDINCLFCFCPLYHLDDCGGKPKYIDGRIKDCSKCSFPHIPENYEKVIERLKKDAK